MIPFFVADRPMSLRLLAASFACAPRIEVGLLTHAQVSDAFADLFARFPEGSRETAKEAEWPVEVRRVGDSGIFKDRMPYVDLFSRYERLKVDYGVMADVFGDAELTLRSAQDAVREYRRQPRGFELVLVAQGRTEDEYLKSYDALRRLGPFPVALGGLLRKRLASVRYLYVGSESQMTRIISRIKAEFAPEWLFVLGAYHPARHAEFEKLGVYGSDYKGWIFQYTHRRDAISAACREALGWTDLSATARELLQRREESAAVEAAARVQYARMKNTGTEQRRLKREFRDAWQSAAATLAQLDVKLLRLASDRRMGVLTRNAVASVARLIGTPERDYRFTGVHDYLSRRVYPQCRDVLGATGTLGAG